jgi:hypothetical protein
MHADGRAEVALLALRYAPLAKAVFVEDASPHFGSPWRLVLLVEKTCVFQDLGTVYCS